VRALVLHGERDIRVEDVDDPRPDDLGGAVVRITHTAICGSDLHLYHGQNPSYPFRPGHEFVGEVVEVGSGVSRFSSGDQVLVAGVFGCGRCPPCLVGDVVACRDGGPKVFGVGPDLHGGQADAVAVPNADTSLLRIPEGVTPEQAVLLTDILPTGWYGAELAGVRPGDTVAVIGLGPVGILAVLSALVMGAARVLAVDPVAERRAVAASLGATPVDPTATGGAGAILELTGGVGADSVIEAVGLQATIHDAIFGVKVGGTVAVIGVNLAMDFPFPMAWAFARDLTFRIGLCPVPGTWPRLVPLVAAGRLTPEIVFTDRIALADGPAAYDRFDRREDGILKVLLTP
jgi:2-desacetyl-2-hydroxyethyl bacteriochlorophyllide A dehydrogenase